MPLFAIAFLCGDLYLQTYSQLPSLFFISISLGASFLFWLVLKKHWRSSYFLFAFVLGMAWSAWYAQFLLAWSLPKEWEGKPLLISGHISSLPVQDKFGTRFVFTIEKMQYEQKTVKKKTHIRLMWSKPSGSLHVGDKWQFLVRLKRIHSTQSPQAFDFEAWALQSGLRATGHVIKQGEKNIFLSRSNDYFIHQIREHLQEKIKTHLPASHSAPWLMALIMGERNGIAQEDWQILRNTGTNHLMAIAGLHIGIMAGLAHWLIAWIWRRIPYLVLRLPALHAGACASLIVAVGYSALAGFSIPTQRACIMLAIFILALLSKRKIQAWQVWSLALIIVLLLNPLSVLTESFWLSFGTIALIIYGMGGRLAPQGFWWKWGRVQWVVGIGLMPMTLVFFQQGSLISFLANSIAIPWLGFLILPFCLLSAVFLFIAPKIGSLLLLIADQSLAWLWVVLTWFSHLHFSSWHQSMPNMAILFLTVVGVLILLLPSGLKGRWLGIIWLLPLFFYPPEKPSQGSFWVTLLDVGQGLSVVVQTKNHVLVYDAGAKLGATFDMGENVVLPYLRMIRAKRIDKLVISHGDNDHIGGAQALLNNRIVTTIQTSVPDKFLSQAAQFCLAGQSWVWDGVRFSFLYPTIDTLNLGNDSSCVLRIDNGVHRILLTGDIEKYAENRLLSQKEYHLGATILVAPHHGSKTSSLSAFIKSVNPQYVLYPIGYRNRYHFPHANVVKAYQVIGAIQLNTAETGTMLFRLEKNEIYPSLELYRIKHKRYWMDE